MKRIAWLVSLALLAAACGGGSDDDTAGSNDNGSSTDQPEAAALPGDDLRLDQLTVLGSHNSYHERPADDVLAALAGFSPELAEEIDYEHRPLTEQLDEFGIRQFEIDVYADPDGGRFANRPALEVIGRPTESGEADLDGPGFKVLHIADIDFLSTCLTFVDCLTEIETWSSSEPDHLPIMIMVEAKQDDIVSSAAELGIDGVDQLGIDFTEVLPFDRTTFDDFEAEITSVFDRERLITPDDIRGDAATLEEAVLAGDAWPTVGEARGKIMFSLVDTGATRDVYVGDATSLEGRLMFTSSEEGRPDAAFIRVDDPIAEADRIATLAKAGYLIRTRTDSPGIDAPAGSTERREAAFASGAHFLSTDYYVEDPALGTGYVVVLDDRCNPVTAPPDCTSPTG
jgi:hypothetical protein